MTSLFQIRIIILQMYCYYKCSVALHHGAVGWSLQCVIVVFPDHTHFLYDFSETSIQEREHVKEFGSYSRLNV